MSAGKPRRNGRTRGALIFGACCSILTPFFGGLLLTACGRQPKAAVSKTVPEVATVTVTPKSVLLTTELPGRTVPYLIAEIRPQVSGLILKRLFTEGSDVKAGQTLYEIDPAPFKAALDNVAANLEASQKAADRARSALSAAHAGVVRQQATASFARTNRKRFEDLFKEKAVSATDCEQAVTASDVAEATLKANEADVQSAQSAVAAAEAAVLQATAALETAKINLGYTKITAPISGRIGTSTVTDGAIVTAYQPAALATLQQLDPIYVDVPQSTVEQLRLRRRMADGRMNRDGADVSKVRLLLEDGARYPLEGTLQFSDVSVDTTTGSVILRMVFPNPDKHLLPNMFVRAVVTEGIHVHAVLLPQQAVSHNPKGDSLALVVAPSGKVEQRMLVLDRALDNQWLVASGLKPGEQVIAEGMQGVQPGMEVRTAPFTK